jgi:hypothetical protein
MMANSDKVRTIRGLAVLSFASLPERGLAVIFFWVDLPGIEHKSMTGHDLFPQNTRFSESIQLAEPVMGPAMIS